MPASLQHRAQVGQAQGRVVGNLLVPLWRNQRNSQTLISFGFGCARKGKASGRVLSASPLHKYVGPECREPTQGAARS
ncbi:MAG: hypothetical protein Kow00123_02300 [Anaerolineales bacterium]